MDSLKDNLFYTMLPPEGKAEMSLIDQQIQAKIAEMKKAVQETCREILIKKGIALAEFDDYQWRRIGKLIESDVNGVAFYLSEYGPKKLYQIKYYEPEMPGWGFDKNPKGTFVVQLGHYEVIEL